MRVAIAGLMHESNTFSGTITDRARFLEASLTRGEELLRRWRDAHHEVGGFLEGSQRAGFDLRPLVMGWATPGGPVADDVLDEVVAEIIEGVRSENAEGLLLALHGAMVTASHLDADAEVLRRIRSSLGDRFPIVTSLDFHANVSPVMGDLSNAIVGYQTYPHVDQRAVGVRAAELMARTLRGEARPVTVIAKPPMVINLLGQETQREPMRSLMAEARALEARPGVLSVSLMAGFPYADVPEMGVSVMAVADGDRVLAVQVAEELGEKLWNLRRELLVPCVGAEEAVRLGNASDRIPVVLVDLGDNIGGGSAGDGTVLLEEVLKQRAQGALVVIHDPAAVQKAIEVGPGGSVAMPVGGKTDRLHGGPVEVHGRVRSLHEGTWVEDQPRHGGLRYNDQGATAVIDLDGGSTLVVNSLRTPPFSLGQLTSLGIDPAGQRLLVVKAAVAYRAAYAPIAGSVIEVDTPGLTAIDPRRFEYRNRRRPLFPWEDEET
ncbi:MAG: M81 family metallopeptidase [Isosphaeraceae bacterium]